MKHSTILEGKAAINYNKDSIPIPELQTPKHSKYEHDSTNGKFHTRPDTKESNASALKTYIKCTHNVYTHEHVTHTHLTKSMWWNTQY